MFINCNNITVKNIKAGHVEKGYCVGDVISLSHCKNSNIDNCDLYGCGVNGLSMYETSGLKISNTEIHDCSENMVIISDCQNISFIKCSMHNCGAGIATWGDKNANITYEECQIIEPVYDDEYYGDYEGDEGDYGYEGGCPNELMEAMNAAGSIFEKKLNNSLANGALYEEFDEECGYIVIPEDGDWYAAYLPQINDDGCTNFSSWITLTSKRRKDVFWLLPRRCPKEGRTLFIRNQRQRTRIRNLNHRHWQQSDLQPRQGQEQPEKMHKTRCDEAF